MKLDQGRYRKERRGKKGENTRRGRIRRERGNASEIKIVQKHWLGEAEKGKEGKIC